MRDYLKKNPIIGIAVAGIAVLLAVYISFFRDTGRRAPRAGDTYYFDANTSKVFIARDYASPIKAPSGDGGDGEPDGYKAFIFACGEAFDPDGLTLDQIVERGGGIAYISMYSPEAATAQVELRSRSFGDGNMEGNRLAALVRQGHLVRSPTSTDGRWFQVDTHEARQIFLAAEQICGAEKLIELEPPRVR